MVSDDSYAIIRNKPKDALIQRNFEIKLPSAEMLMIPSIIDDVNPINDRHAQLKGYSIINPHKNPTEKMRAAIFHIYHYCHVHGRSYRHLATDQYNIWAIERDAFLHESDDKIIQALLPHFTQYKKEQEARLSEQAVSSPSLTSH